MASSVRSGVIDGTGAKVDFKENRGASFSHSFHSSVSLEDIVVTVQLADGAETELAVDDDTFDFTISASDAANYGYGVNYKIFLTYEDGLKEVEFYGRIDFV